jgi:hypothetical protein
MDGLSPRAEGLLALSLRPMIVDWYRRVDVGRATVSQVEGQGKIDRKGLFKDVRLMDDKKEAEFGCSCCYHMMCLQHLMVMYLHGLHEGDFESHHRGSQTLNTPRN